MKTMQQQYTTESSLGQAPPEGYTWYFAYGSNNSYEQLLRRLGNIPPTASTEGEEEAIVADTPTTTKSKRRGDEAIAKPNFGGVHNQSTSTIIFPPLAIKVVLLPSFFFVIDAPSAQEGLGYANIRERSECSEKKSDGAGGSESSHQHGYDDGARSTCAHRNDSTKSAEELAARVPYVISVAYLISNAQLAMMDKFENAPEKYRRKTVKAHVVGSVEPLPKWERRELSCASSGGSSSSSPASPSGGPAPSGAVCVIRDEEARATVISSLLKRADELHEVAGGCADGTNPPRCEKENKEGHHQSSFLSTREAYLSKLVKEFTTITDATNEVIEGVAYIYEGTEPLHTDVVGDSSGGSNSAMVANSSTCAPTLVDQKIGDAKPLPKRVCQPSSSYMGRILEGEHLFAMSLSTLSPSSLNNDNTCNAHRARLVDQLLGAYVQYLRAIEVSPIPSPRSSLRAAGKV